MGFPIFVRIKPWRGRQTEQGEQIRSSLDSGRVAQIRSGAASAWVRNQACQ